HSGGRGQRVHFLRGRPGRTADLKPAGPSCPVENEKGRRVSERNSAAPQLASQSGVDLPVRANALLEQGNEAGLLKVTVSCQSLVHAVLPHDDERNAVGE